MTTDDELPRFFREYLYVDIDRVRAIVAQLDQGVPESATDTDSTATGHTFGVDARAIRYERARTSTGQTATTRALGDLLVPWFEELAEAGGFLSDVTDVAGEEANWRSGDLHAGLDPGRLIRVTAKTRVLDPEFLATTIESAGALARMFGLAANDQSSAAARPATGRTTPKGGRQQAPRSSTSGFDKAVEGFTTLARHLLGGGLTIRSFPAGEQSQDCNFSGVLLDRSHYIEAERHALFAKFGVSASEWTIVGSVARVPMPSGAVAMPDISRMSLAGSDGVDRNVLEGALVTMLAYFETVGLISSPRWPAIAITPLALYRTVQANSP